jgi:hypothetical protein
MNRKTIQILPLLLMFCVFGCGVKKPRQAKDILYAELMKSCPFPELFDDNKKPGIFTFAVEDENYVFIGIHDLDGKEKEDLIIARITEIVKSKDIRCRVEIDFYEKGFITVIYDKDKKGKMRKRRKQGSLSKSHRTEIINKINNKKNPACASGD